MGKIKISDIKIKAAPLLKRHGIKKAAIFGSFVRGEDNKHSDIDFLVEFIDGDTKTLLDLIGLELDLEELFNRKVDVITYNSIHPLLKEHILREQEVFYEEKSKNIS